MRNHPFPFFALNAFALMEVLISMVLSAVIILSISDLFTHLRISQNQTSERQIALNLAVNQLSEVKKQWQQGKKLVGITISQQKKGIFYFHIRQQIDKINPFYYRIRIRIHWKQNNLTLEDGFLRQSALIQQALSAQGTSSNH